MFLSGSNVDDRTTCLKLHSGIVQSLRLLKCDHEEAVDRIMCHFNNAVTINNFTRMVVASADADILVCLMYPFSRLKQFNLNELWAPSCQGATKRAMLFHDLVSATDRRILDVLPVVHSLNG